MNEGRKDGRKERTKGKHEVRKEERKKERKNASKQDRKHPRTTNPLFVLSSRRRSHDTNQSAVAEVMERNP